MQRTTFRPINLASPVGPRPGSARRHIEYGPSVTRGDVRQGLRYSPRRSLECSSLTDSQQGGGMSATASVSTRNVVIAVDASEVSVDQHRTYPLI
jgi:hypothetical protein